MTNGPAKKGGSSTSQSKEVREVDVRELDSGFKYEIAKEDGGENIRLCFQCGSCSAVCSVGAADPSYDPRKILRMALLGMRDEVLKSKFIWLCASCYICHERCPQGVRITDIMGAIQNIAVREGHVHPMFITSVDILDEHGRLIEIDMFENKMRSKMGLPHIEEKREALGKLFESTGIKKKLKKNKKKSKKEGG